MLGRIIVGWAAFEELCGRKREVERLFSNKEINDLRKILKKEYGSIPDHYLNLISRMADKTQFPKISLFRRMIEAIESE